LTLRVPLSSKLVRGAWDATLPGARLVINESSPGLCPCLPPGLPSRMDGTGENPARPCGHTAPIGNLRSVRLRWSVPRRAEMSWRRFHRLRGRVSQDKGGEKEPPSPSLRCTITPSLRQGRRGRLGPCLAVACPCWHDGTSWLGAVASLGAALLSAQEGWRTGSVLCAVAVSAWGSHVVHTFLYAPASPLAGRCAWRSA